MGTNIHCLNRNCSMNESARTQCLLSLDRKIFDCKSDGTPLSSQIIYIHEKNVIIIQILRLNQILFTAGLSGGNSSKSAQSLSWLWRALTRSILGVAGLSDLSVGAVSSLFMQILSFSWVIRIFAFCTAHLLFWSIKSSTLLFQHMA